jgi:hypothetical protein
MLKRNRFIFIFLKVIYLHSPISLIALYNLIILYLKEIKLKV